MSAWLTARGDAPASAQDAANGTGMAHSSMQVEGMDQTAVTADLKGRNGKGLYR